MVAKLFFTLYAWNNVQKLHHFRTLICLLHTFYIRILINSAIKSLVPTVPTVAAQPKFEIINLLK